jgi:hypothetical protein
LTFQGGAQRQPHELAIALVALILLHHVSGGCPRNVKRMASALILPSLATDAFVAFGDG